MDADFDIYLASKSPRRRELLAQIGVQFELLDIDTDESTRAGEAPVAYVERVARDKAVMGVDIRSANAPVLGADTSVVCDGVIFGKPGNLSEATAMLQAMSDRSHQVITAVALADDERVSSLVQCSRVTMSVLSPTTIEAYWHTGEPCDKAGAYAIQGLAAGFIQELQGSYSAVMGLPLMETLQLLREFSVTGFTQPESFLLRHRSTRESRLE